MKRVVVMAVMAGMLVGCGSLRGRGPRTPTVGERTAVLSSERPVTADASLEQTPVLVPGPVDNPDWPQPGGSPSHSLIHVGLGAQPTRAWSVSIGEGSGPRGRLASEPVVADGKVFTIDTRAVVRAFNAQTGAQLWERQVEGENIQRATLFGGGVSFDDGKVFATNGAGYTFALNANTGEQIWAQSVGSPLRGSPTVASGTVYVVSQDNQIFALDATTGRPQWNASAAVELAGVFGSAAPAFAQSTIVAGFSSGELNAFRYENGHVVWQDALARTGISTVVGNLSDIDADPVIDNGRVFAVGQGGRMVAVELITGQRAWELNIAGISTPWVSGEWIFVVTDRAQVIAVQRSSGRIRWIAQLQRFRVDERRSEPDRETGQVRVRQGRDPIFWRGPVLAGGRLVLTSSRGQVAYVNPADGAVITTFEAGRGFSLPPIVAGGTMYLLDETGQLSAWR